MKHTLYNNYFYENDEHGKDAYDYARQEIWETDEEHIFPDETYLSSQISFEGLETYTCPICGEKFSTLEEAKDCCKDEKWNTIDDIPDDLVTNKVYADDDVNCYDFKVEFGRFLKNAPNGFLLCGTSGRWDGTYSGGCYVKNFDDLYKFWKDCDYIKVWDENGHLYFMASHHDGTNYAELKELTDKGHEYMNNHIWESDREVHEKLFNSNFYTKLPHYAHKVWGVPKV